MPTSPEVGNVIRPCTVATIPSVIPAKAGIHVAALGVCLPASCRKGTLHVTPSVFPAKAGIHVASPVSYARELP